jgi:uncharacterized protein YqfA (UPF0365 family)
MNAPPAAPDQSMVGVVMVLVAAVVALIFLVMIATVFASLFLPWLRGFMGGAPVTILQLIGMRIRGVPPRLIVDALITLVHRGHPPDRGRYYLAESLYLAQRGLIQSPEQLADQVEKQLKSRGPQ